MTTFIDVLLCVDCVMIAANGELGTGDEVADQEHIDRMNAYDERPIIVTCGEDQDDCHDFSNATCGGCGTQVAGTRHTGAIESEEE